MSDQNERDTLPLFLLPIDIDISRAAVSLDSRLGSSYDSCLDELHDEFVELSKDFEHELSEQEDLTTVLRILTANPRQEYFKVQTTLKALLYDMESLQALERKRSKRFYIQPNQLRESRPPRLRPYTLEVTGLRDRDEVLWAWKKEFGSEEGYGLYVKMDYDPDEAHISAHVYIDDENDNDVRLYEEIGLLFETNDSIKETVIDSFLNSCTDVQVYNTNVGCWLPAE